MPQPNLTRPLTWSYSAWSAYDTCPAKYHYAYVERRTQPETPALIKGKRVHKLAEDYVAGKIRTLPQELRKFVSGFEDLRELGAQPEREILLNQDWQPTDKEGRWLKTVLDAALVYTDGTADVVDYKTGRRYDSHMGQMQLYSLALMSAEPTIEKVTVRLWYLDSGEESIDTVLASGAEEMRQMWTARAGTMLADEELSPRPGHWCRWCPFHKDAGGPCWGM